MNGLIVVIIALIISAIMASNKNKKARVSAEIPKKPQHETDAWEDIIDKIDEGDFSYETSIEDAELIEAERIRQKRMAELRKRYNKPKQSDIMASDDEQESVKKDAGKDTTKHFNARDAVIYSEILKPKF